MTAPVHHLSEPMLIGFAAGTADAAWSLIAETHVDLCAVCRASVDEVVGIGGAILEDLAPSEVAPGALEALMARLDEPTPPPKAALPRLPDFIPPALQRYVHEAGGLSWKWVLPGVHKVELPVKVGDRPVQLVRFRAGLDIGLHGHEGAEISVVLTGGFTDDQAHYGAGDVAVVDATVQHRPLTDDGVDCILLVAGEGASLPLSPLGKIVSRFVRF